MPQYPNLSYHAVNLKGIPFIYIQYLELIVVGDQHCDTEEDTVNAVTWGIFPGKEVLQVRLVESYGYLMFVLSQRW